MYVQKSNMCSIHLNTPMCCIHLNTSRKAEQFMTVQPRMASAVMLLRDITEDQRAQGIEGVEVFMVRRVIQSDFMPDVYVFPGGSVSKDDLAAEREDGICTPVAP